MIFLLGILACTTSCTALNLPSPVVSGLEGKYDRYDIGLPHLARPSKNQLDCHIVAYKPSQFAEGTTNVSVVKRAENGSYSKVKGQTHTVNGTEDIIFYVPYPGDTCYLAGDNWMSKDSLFQACQLKNATAESMQQIGTALTERQLDMGEGQGIPCNTMVIQCIYRRASPAQRFFFGLFNALLVMMLFMVCYQCCCASAGPEVDAILVLPDPENPSPGQQMVHPRRRPDYHEPSARAQAHIIEHPAHVPMEQAFLENPQDLRSSNSPEVTIVEDSDFNEADATL